MQLAHNLPLKKLSLSALPSPGNYCTFKEVKTFAVEPEIAAALRPTFLMRCLTNIKFSLPDVVSDGEAV